jgi:4-hydroxythreonine-4-phosphate dehydrogenase
MSIHANARPILVTMGDPSGIGPETIVRAHRLGAMAGCVVVGDADVMQRAAAQVDRADKATAPGVPSAQHATLHVVAPADMPQGLASLTQGVVHAAAGAASAACITHAAQAALRGEAAAVVTAPINKLALSAAGLRWPGHTEMLQALAAEHVGHAVNVRMMLANDELKVVLATIHVSLRTAIDALNAPLIMDTISMAHSALATAQRPKPRIAVAGLNPHAGEGGLFGDEELHIIGPAVAQARAAGMDVHGPFAPDTVFMRARRGEFDVVIAMTHDHGLIPVKYLGVEQGVNVTLGLPFVRTSPDHGTAYDMAGTGRADPSSLMAALRYARHAAGIPEL